MCRLFGHIQSSSIPPLDEIVFQRLTALSRQGGPDSTEYHLGEHAQFGFNRLAILDTSAHGNQPMTSPSGRFVLMVNGEIYNFKELARQHRLTGLRSGSDTEVLAQLLDLLPFETLVRSLNGMFAIAAWDRTEKRLFLARDPAGIKPLFYAPCKEGLVFGSQFDQILLHPWMADWNWSDTGLREYLQFGFMTAPYTVADKVFQLEPGTWMSYDQVTASVEEGRYALYFHGDAASKSETDSIVLEEGLGVLKEAVASQMVADVPLGLFLSGGIDSTLVAAMASKQRPDVETLTVGFEDKSLDESVKAAEYARILGLRNRCIIMSDAELLKTIDQHDQAQTEPFADYSSLPTYLISKVAATQFKVMLSGDGGDELFWGYPRFRTFSRSAPYFHVPTPFLRKVTKRLMKSFGVDLTGFLDESSVGDANLAFHSYLHPNILERTWPGSALSSQTVEAYHCAATSREEVLLHLRQNEFYQHLQKILVKVDRMSMANALEVRVPILDLEMLRYASGIRPEMLHTHNELKYLPKKMLGSLIPSSVIEQRKKGFTPPLRIWSRTILKDKIRDTIGQGTLKSLPLARPEVLRVYADQYLAGSHDNLEGMWTIYSLIQWERRLAQAGSGLA